MYTLQHIGEYILDFLTTPNGTLQFVTLTFWAAFVVFFALYLLCRCLSRRLMLVYVTLFSLFFAYNTNGLLMLLLPATILVSWALTEAMRRCSGGGRKAMLWLVVVLDLLPLLFFKYGTPLGELWRQMLESNFSLPSIAMPVGISFYTFQTISYSVDVYRRRFTERASLLEYSFYISFFPLLLAGPITRAETLIPQLKRPVTPKPVRVYSGLWLIILGLLKKGLIADYIAEYNNWIFDNPMAYSGFEDMMGLVGYALQIYCDFSGYSDLSIGIADLLGFRLRENFSYPYQSLNLTEFWRRWHMSLSFWFRDYVYIPMGGNRKGAFRTYLNNFLTMVVAGLWHGSTWMFAIWGALHGMGLVVHKMCRRWLDYIPNVFFVRVLAWMLTFSYLLVTWSFFRADSLQTVNALWYNIRTTFSWDYLVPFVQARPVWTLFVALGFLFHTVHRRGYDFMLRAFVRSPWIVKCVVFAIVVQLIINFRQDTVQPFIYSQF